ncbi:MAG TPA: hypothetical protein VMV48_03795 [Gallionellaceae bacterium]|nr:hypothetical protein [Gallionellaceae bacterium]
MSLPKFLAVLLLAFITLNVCAAETEPEEVRQLRWVQQANPIVDAKAAVARNDFVLLGVLGYTWSIPGIQEEKKFVFREKYGVKLLEGTSDVILGTEHGRLIKLATEYAEKYNQYVLSHANQK